MPAIAATLGASRQVEVFGEIFAVIAPVFVTAAIGFGWTRLGMPFETEMTRRVVTNIGTPCLLFSALTGVAIDGAALSQMLGAAALAFVGFAALGILVLKATRLPLHSYLPALMFPNCGNMGLPLCLFAFGEHGLALGIVVFLVASCSQFTIGVGIAAGHASFARLFRTPILYAAPAALAFVFTGTPVPAWLANTTELIGGLTIPLMLLALGVSLARLHVTTLGRTAALSAVRLLGGFAIGLLVAEALGLEGAARGVLIVQASMPVAVFNYLFAQQFERKPEEVAGMIVISTAVSFATLPALLWFVL
jgi:predicted permease